MEIRYVVEYLFAFLGLGIYRHRFHFCIICALRMFDALRDSYLRITSDGLSSPTCLFSSSGGFKILSNNLLHFFVGYIR